jgi:hypothetical protein
MSMTTALDPLSYARLPRLDTADALSLGRMLLTLAIRNPGVAVSDALEHIEGRITTLAEAWTEQAVPIPRHDMRAIDTREDRLFSAIRDRLATYRALSHSKNRARALEIHELLFADGLGFLCLPYPRQHAEAERRLALIDKHRLATDIDALVGEEFLAELRVAHVEYGEALGIGRAPEPVPEATRVAEPLRALIEAMVDYAIQMLALARAKPARAEAVRRALGPIDRFRTAAAARVASGSPPTDASVEDGRTTSPDPEGDGNAPQ